MRYTVTCRPPHVISQNDAAFEKTHKMRFCVQVPTQGVLNDTLKKYRNALYEVPDIHVNLTTLYTGSVPCASKPLSGLNLE
jgi:hypothetical protein